MVLLSENPAFSRRFEPTLFWQCLHVHCWHSWQQHKGATSEDHLLSRIKVPSIKRGFVVKEKSEIKKLVQSNEGTCTPGDEWCNVCGSFHCQDENCLEEMVMSIPTCSSKVPKIPGLPKIVNLIDFDECNMPADISACQQCLTPSTQEKNPDMGTSVIQKELVTISVEELPIGKDLGLCGFFSLEQTTLCAPTCKGIGVQGFLPSWQERSDAMNLIECGQACVPFGHPVMKGPQPPQSWREPKLVGACYTPEHPKFSTPGNSEDLEKKNQILLKRLACAGELKSIEPSFVQDEVKDKQQMIDELIMKGRELEAKLSKLTIMTFPASELARQVKVLQDLRAQLDKRMTLLDRNEGVVQWCEDSCPASGGGYRKKGCFRFKPPRIRESFSSVFQSIFSKRSQEFDM